MDTQQKILFKTEKSLAGSGTVWLEALVLLSILGALAFCLWIAVSTSHVAPITAKEISLETSALPVYAAYSLGRMTLAYILSMLFAIVYGSIASRSRQGGRVLMAVLDVLQSVPILSFLPVVLLTFTAILPQRVAVEMASVALIFTSQAWNLAYAWYQSRITTPKELREASATFRLNNWLRFRILSGPSATISLIWNSIMSWAGGWFFLMAAEIFTVGDSDYRLPGLGSYLQQAANSGDISAILWGIATLVAVIIALDQLVWRPLLSWSERFKLSMVSDEEGPSSWFLEVLQTSRLANWFRERIYLPALEKLDFFFVRHQKASPEGVDEEVQSTWGSRATIIVVIALLFLGLWSGGGLLLQVSFDEWLDIGIGLSATLVRVVVALLVAIAWTLPVGVIIATNPKWARFVQPMVQIAASVPATAIFPIFLMFLVHLAHGLDVAAVLLMLLGAQWYLLFNIIAGASAIPRDLKDTSTLLGLSAWMRWKTLVLPALFPYIVTGAITAAGGAWNASIVSEYVHFGGETLMATGIGAIIARSAAEGNFPLLLAATLSMIVIVAVINMLFWRRIYTLAEERFRME